MSTQNPSRSLSIQPPPSYKRRSTPKLIIPKIPSPPLPSNIKSFQSQQSSNREVEGDYSIPGSFPMKDPSEPKLSAQSPSQYKYETRSPRSKIKHLSSSSESTPKSSLEEEEGERERGMELLEKKLMTSRSL